MNFLKDFLEEYDRREKVRMNNERMNAIMALRAERHCDHTVIVHRRYDGFDRHVCTKCCNTEISRQS